MTTPVSAPPCDGTFSPDRVYFGANQTVNGKNFDAFIDPWYPNSPCGVLGDATLRGDGKAVYLGDGLIGTFAPDAINSTLTATQAKSNDATAPFTNVCGASGMGELVARPGASDVYYSCLPVSETFDTKGRVVTDVRGRVWAASADGTLLLSAGGLSAANWIIVPPTGATTNVAVSVIDTHTVVTARAHGNDFWVATYTALYQVNRDGTSSIVGEYPAGPGPELSFNGAMDPNGALYQYTMTGLGEHQIWARGPGAEKAVLVFGDRKPSAVTWRSPQAFMTGP